MFFLFLLAIRLKGFDRPHAGRIEVLYKGVWGTVNAYKNELSFTEARVVCRQLGYRDAVRALNVHEVPNVGRGAVWTKNIKCNGTESRLHDCKWTVDNFNHVNHNYDGGVICKFSKFRF